MELVVLFIVSILAGAGLAHLKHKFLGLSLEVTPRTQRITSDTEWLFSDNAFNGSMVTDSVTGGGVNPCTGLPLIDDSMVDVGGNVYGSCDEI